MKEEKDAVLDMVDAIYEIELDPQYYLSIWPEYSSEIRIDNIFREVKRGTKTNVQALQEANTAVDGITPTEQEDGAAFFPLMDCMMGDHAVEVVPTMIHAIDSPMNGGLGLGEFGIVCGISGLGKTTLAVNFCWGGAFLGFPVVLVTLELPAKKISERLYSRVTNVSYARIRHGDNGNMDPVKTEVLSKLREISGEEVIRRFQIWDYSENSCNIKTLDNRLEILQKEGRLPKMLFLDWLDALNSNPIDRKNGYVQNKELRHQLQSYSQECSRIAKKYNIAVWATTQSNAQGDGQRKVGMRNSSEGFSKAYRCSVFLGMGATDEDRLSNRVTVTAGKMRDGRIFSTEIEADLDYQRFSDIVPEESLPSEMVRFVRG